MTVGRGPSRHHPALPNDIYMTRHSTFCLVLLLSGLSGCNASRPPEWHEEDGYRWAELRVPRRGKDGFQRLLPNKTGISFSNSVTEEQVLQNEHILNGSGVAVGDIDGDGLADLYFAALDGSNVLYRNLGDWKFVDVTDRAGVGAQGRFSTGATFADIDGDGDLDLLVTALGGPNALYLNDGTGVFEDHTKNSGLESKLYGTTMTLADVDGDGDLDLYVANNKVKSVRDIYPPDVLEFDRVVQEVAGTYSIRPEFRDHYTLLHQKNRLMRLEYAEPDKFYLNDGTGRFEEVSFTAGGFLDEDGKPLAATPRDWGLAARFSDIDGDGDPDLYVCNDFETPDRLWINDGHGRFRAVQRVALRLTSNATMAVDFSDIDRDGDMDFMLLDMFDRDNRLRKTQVSAMQPDPAELGEIENRPQVGRNTMFVNQGDGTFSEIARLAGVEASGWSWSIIFLDVDLDGYQDILIGNGHERDFMDADTKARINRARPVSDWRQLRLLYPNLYLRNVAFRNNGDLTFVEKGEEWGFADEEDVSHGAATGDLDGDGDLDVVINRLGKPAGVYRNESNRPRVTVRLKGLVPNTQGIGAKIHLLGGPVADQVSEVTAGGGYVSGSDPVYMFAAGGGAMRIWVEWRSGRESMIEGVVANRLYEIYESGSVEVEAEADTTVDVVALFRDVTSELGHVHVETEYDDWVRQPLLRHRLSQLGPGVTWYDMDDDGDEDLLIGGGRGGSMGYYRNEGGRLRRVSVRMGGVGLDETTLLAIPNGEGGTRLLVGQMNYEASSPAAAREAASVLGLDADWGGGVVVAREFSVVPGEMSSTGPLAVADYDGDGDLDLFVGGRVVPMRYPTSPVSRLYLNDGLGGYELDTLNAGVLSGIGMVSSAVYTDVDADGDVDLLLALDWGSLHLLENEGGVFSDVTESWGLSEYESMWNGVTTGDFNADGLPDIVATSWGRNTGREVSHDRPLVVYFSDFDENGTMDPIEARYDDRLSGLTPIRGLTALRRGIPYVGRRFSSADEFADATLQDVLGPALGSASVLKVNVLDNMVFMNEGSGFRAQQLPIEAQVAPAFYAGVADVDGDGNEDIFLAQNFYPNELEVGRYAEGRGLWLRGDGQGGFDAISGTLSGIKIYGDQRGAALADYNGDGRVDLVVSQNANATRLYRNEGAEPGMRVRLVGNRSNPRAVGATVRFVYGETRGPAREIHAGSGYWSSDGAVQVLGLGGQPTGVWVRWPGGEETLTGVGSGAGDVTIRMPRADGAGGDL